MLCMCREFNDESVFYVGLRSGVVQAFSSSERQFTMECDVTGGMGTLVGLGKHERSWLTNSCLPVCVTYLCLLSLFLPSPLSPLTLSHLPSSVPPSLPLQSSNYLH